MAARKTIQVPVNRVEGDLEVRVDIGDGVVVDAWSVGTTFRGFEGILTGRAAMDSLVVAPRICGMCSVAHLTAAALALDEVAGAEVPDNAIRLRNVALMAEHIQSDVRQSLLMFAADFTNPAHRDLAFFADALHRYEPFRGASVVEAVRATRGVIEIIAVLSGQWPHSAFMVPGGVVSMPGAGELMQCQHLLQQYRQWYERHVLGCSLERWAEVRSASELEAWLEERAEHREGALGFLIGCGQAVGLDRLGAGHGHFLSFGSFPLPASTSVQSPDNGRVLVSAGFSDRAGSVDFDQARVEESVAHSWYRDTGGSRHPSAGETRPYASGDEAGKYSWAKAPRYDGLPAETGPLAERVVAGDPLFLDLIRQSGASALVRQVARLVRPATLMPAMRVWIEEMSGEGRFYQKPASLEDGQGHGLTEAARGALGHWVEVADGRVVHYQIVTPTVWNGSPRDEQGVRGPWEEALVGTPVDDVDNPILLGHVIRSFDPCMVCCVHAWRDGRRLAKVRL